jgi:hypothetical protein
MDALSMAVDQLEEESEITSRGAQRLRQLLADTSAHLVPGVVLDRHVVRVLDRLSLPSRAELEHLHMQLDQLDARLKGLTGQPAGTGPTA